MRTELFDILDYKEEEHFIHSLDIQLSLDPFIGHLKRLMDEGSKERQEIFGFILEKFAQAEKLHGPIAETNLSGYDGALFYAYNVLVPALQEEKNSYWALSYPLGAKIFYGTDSFYKLLTQQICNETFNQYKATAKHQHIEREIYALILERLYQIPAIDVEDMVYSFENEQTELRQYFSIKIDKRFIEITPKGELPDLDYKKLRQNSIQQFDWKILRELLPLTLFTFRGFSVININEITEEKVIQNIREVVSSHASQDVQTDYTGLTDSLKVLIGNQHVKFGLSPILQLNNKPILDQVYMHGSILPKLLKKKTRNCEQANISEAYLLNPQIILYNVGIEIGNNSFKFLDDLSDLGVTSYVCIPLYYNNKVTGLLEVYTDNGHTFDKFTIAKLRKVSPLLAQLLYDEAHRFNEQIQAVIKEKFTSLQPSVQWRFNEAAYEYLKKIKPDKPKPVIDNVAFKHVYPLYGAIDIRNSTIERNRALIADFKTQLQLLQKVLQQIKKFHHIAIIDEMDFNCNKWLTQLDLQPIDSLQPKIRDFLEKEAFMLLQHFKGSNAQLAEIINQYEEETLPDTGLTHKHRRALESSMATINSAINGYLELLNEEIQQSYPCYFEKFRTDGVEYDIYIGQSIAPEIPFNLLYLKNVRLWQLSAMAAIAKITHSLLNQMETPLETTQLIFINGNDIDISFRVDERRFDVEGSYNIRYHVIKKRIDKVHLKDSYERLTQPGKIALVYYDSKDIREYRNYITYLQDKDILLDDVEELELEELQGVSGLKAIRVGVKY